MSKTASYNGKHQIDEAISDLMEATTLAEKIRTRNRLDMLIAATVAGQASSGHCERVGGCVCGGDVPAVREGCSEWVKPAVAERNVVQNITIEMNGAEISKIISDHINKAIPNTFVLNYELRGALRYVLGCAPKNSDSRKMLEEFFKLEQQ